METTFIFPSDNTRFKENGSENTLSNDLELTPFKDFLLRKGASDNTIRIYLLAVRHFFSHSDSLWEDGEYNYYFLIRLMAATGVRISELVLFDVEDVKKGYRDIYSKGNKLRRVYIPAVLRKAFEEWPGFSQRPDGILFLNRFGAPLSASGIRFQLKVFAARYDIDPDVMYPHSFRHRFAKNFIEVCPDIALLSDLLGHDSIETTRIYLRRSSREQYRIVNQVVNW